MKFTLRLISAMLCLLMLLGCVTVAAEDGFDQIKADYLAHIINENEENSKYTVNDILITENYGNYSGYDIVVMGIAGQLVSPATGSITIAGITFTFGYAADIATFYAYKDGSFTPVSDAYDAGLLTKTDIYNLAVAKGDVVLPKYKELWSDGNIVFTLEETTSTLYLSGEGRTDDYDTMWVIGGLGVENYSPLLGDDSIKHVVIEEGITYIGEYLFDDCENIETVTLPDSLEEIADRCFYRCSKISHVIFPEGIKRLGEFCFENENLNTLTFCGNLPKMRENSVLEFFEGTVYYPKSNSTWDTVVNKQYSGSIVWESWSIPNIKFVYNRFIDVSKNVWYTDAVQFVFDTGMMTGMNKTLFSPNTALTRAQVVTILFNLSGEDANDYVERTYFDDVSLHSWYAPVITWAYENNITRGVSDTKFAPNQKVKRSELVTFLLNFAKDAGYTEVPEAADLKLYDDYKGIADWAYEGMAWAVHEGIVSGMTETTLVPNANANRAQAARMLMKYYEYLDRQIPMLSEAEQAIADYVMENGERNKYYTDAYEYVVENNGKWYMIEYFTHGSIKFSYCTSPNDGPSFKRKNFDETLSVYTLGLSDEYKYDYYNRTNDYLIDSKGILTSEGFNEADFDNNHRTLSDEAARDLRDGAMSEITGFINAVLDDCGITMNDLFIS